jgi:hypothetical protein
LEGVSPGRRTRERAIEAAELAVRVSLLRVEKIAIQEEWKEWGTTRLK